MPGYTLADLVSQKLTQQMFKRCACAYAPVLNQTDDVNVADGRSFASVNNQLVSSGGTEFAGPD